MGVIYLLFSKLSTIVKMIAMKKCGSIAAGARNSLIINLIRSVGCILVALTVALISGFSPMEPYGMLICILSGIANAGLLFAWVLCAEKGSLCTVEIFCMIGGVVLPMLISPVLFKGETITALQWIGSVLLLPAAYCFSKKANEKKASFTPSLLILLLTNCISNALIFLTQKYYTYYSLGSVSDFNLYTFIFCAATLAIAFLCISIIKPNRSEEKKEGFKLEKHIIVYISLAIGMLYAAQYFSTLASASLPSAYFFPLSYAIGMPLTFLTDITVFKEKIKISSLIGLALVIISVVLIGLNI
jgi:uncharacterized membrane protein